MALQKPSVVIFDMDGTTVRHLNPKLLSVLEFLDTLAYRFNSLLTWAFKRGAKGNPLQDWDAYEQRKKPRLLVHRTMHRLRRKEVDQIVEPSPGIYAVLDLLKAHHIPMGLASNGLGTGYGHDILQKFDLEDYFQATVFREDILKSKPNPESLLLTLKKLATVLQADDVVWYIGDRRKDVQAALEAQKHLPCPVVPIAYTVDAALEVVKEQLSPDHIMPSHDLIHQKLLQLF